jgi:hypothetical protein
MKSAALLRVPALGGLVVLGTTVYFGALWLLGFRLADFRGRTV